jgi:hypothetical protein
MTSNGRKYWFAHPQGKPKAWQPASWQGWTLFCVNIGALVGVGQFAGRALWNQAWTTGAAALAACLAIILIYAAVARLTGDPQRTAEEYQREAAKRRNALNARLTQRMDAGREAIRARRNIEE